MRWIDNCRRQGYAGPLTHLEETRFDVIIKQELRKGEEALAQELVREVDGGVHDTCTSVAMVQ